MKDLVCGAVNKSDGQQFEKLKKGKLPVAAEIDLHGYPLHEARLEFYDFIRDVQKAGARVALVVTGKGGPGGGVIKQSLHSWVNDPDLQPLILTYCHTPPNMGGSGAFLLLLKKNVKNKGSESL